MKALDFDFPLMSEMSVRPPFAVGADERAAEVAAELERRARHYPAKVAQRKMTQEASDRHVAILAAIAADLAGQWHRAISWDAKVRELRRELAMRRNAYPRYIAGRRMSEAEAVKRMERMEAVHWRYWIALDYFDGGGAEPEDRAGITGSARFDAVRAQGEKVRAWEIAQHAAGNPAARLYLTPDEIIALAKGRKAA